MYLRSEEEKGVAGMAGAMGASSAEEPQRGKTHALFAPPPARSYRFLLTLFQAQGGLAGHGDIALHWAHSEPRSSLLRV